MNPKKDKWKDEILNSVAGKQDAEPNPFLFSKITRKLLKAEQEQQPRGIKKPLWALTYAAMLGLFVLNFFAISELQEQSDYSSSQVELGDNPYTLVFQDDLSIYGDE